MRSNNTILHQLRTTFIRTVNQHGLADKSVSIAAAPLSPSEAIGHPEAADYPIVKGRERMMEATFLGAKGQAFTDTYGAWSGTISDVIHMDFTDNFRRAVFVASLNAVMRHLGLIEQTVHCKDGDPRRCSQKCLELFVRKNPDACITVIGYQPRIVEMLSGCLTVNVVDMDTENIGRRVAGTLISGPEMTEQLLEKADVLLVTGTTLVNETIEQFLNRKAKTIFYGVTIAGAAKILGLERFCPFAS